MGTSLIEQISKTITIAAVAAVLTACATSKASKSEAETDPFAGIDVDEIVEAGDNALRQGEYDRAMFIYMQAAEVEESADTWYRIGITKIRLNDKQFAWNAFRKALELDPDHVQTHEDLGLLYVGMGQPKQAAGHLERSIELDATRWRAHSALGVMADVDDRYAEAVAHYQVALEHNPGSAMLMNNIGYSYYLAGDLEESTNWLKSAIKADPDYELAVRNLALLYARQGSYREAVDTFARVVEKPKAYNDIGYIALRNGDFDDAGLLLTEAIRLSPTYYETAYENLEQLEEAIKTGRVDDEREQLAEDIGEVDLADDQQVQMDEEAIAVLVVDDQPEQFADDTSEVVLADDQQVQMDEEAIAVLVVDDQPEQFADDTSEVVLADDQQVQMDEEAIAVSVVDDQPEQLADDTSEVVLADDQQVQMDEEAIAVSVVDDQPEQLADDTSEVVSADNQEVRMYKVRPRALNVRSAPSTDSEIVDYLKAGNEVQIVHTRDKWAFISYRPKGIVRDLTGWVSAHYLISEPIAAPADADASTAGETAMAVE